MRSHPVRQRDSPDILIHQVAFVSDVGEVGVDCGYRIGEDRNCRSEFCELKCKTDPVNIYTSEVRRVLLGSPGRRLGGW